MSALLLAVAIREPGLVDSFGSDAAIQLSQYLLIASVRFAYTETGQLIFQKSFKHKQE
jgi:hypothetical protein